MNSQNRFRLDGKTALVTGAAGLLGREHSVALTQVGARVIMTDIDLDSLRDAQIAILANYPDAQLEVHKLDVADEGSVLDLSESLCGNGIHIDILVNNAAIDPKVDDGHITVGEPSRLENMPLDQWDFQIRVGLTGAFLCSRVFGQAMAESERPGVILNIASDLSVFSPDQRLYAKPETDWRSQPVKPVTYSVIKTGLIGLTRYLATYWCDRGVRSNALSPGGVYTGQNEEFVQQLSERVPLGRMATKEEYHGAIQFLCSDASSYMNGQNVVMDGGRSVW